MQKEGNYIFRKFFWIFPRVKKNIFSKSSLLYFPINAKTTMDAWLVKKSLPSNEQSRVEVGDDNEQLGACSTQKEQRNDRSEDKQNTNEQSTS